MRIVQYLVVFSAVLALGACVSGPVSVPDDITPAELIQRGQEAADRSRYNQALQYYRIILDRFPSNIDVICAADYEIGLIHFKQKKYDDAKGEFEALLERYNIPDEELLPPQYKRLANIMLGRITEVEKRKQQFPYF